jgi:probable phosphomutase (TIGR03848 family)
VTLLLLVRHALTEATGKRLTGQLPGFHVSDHGRDQARDLAGRLAPLPIAALYTSPLERCLETARPIAEGRRLEPVVVPELADVSYGRWSGRSLATLYRTRFWRQLQAWPSSVRFPDGETLTEVQRRSVDALDSIAARHSRRIVAVITHADVIRLAVAHYTGIHVDLFQRIVVGPASVSAVAVGERVPRLVRLNDTGTLTDLVPRAKPRPDAAADGQRRTGGAGNKKAGRPAARRSGAPKTEPGGA